MKIEFRNINKSFDAVDGMPVKALEGINLVIPSAQFLVVIGSNGSGKSTLLNILSGTLAPDTGNLLVDERELKGKKEYEISRLVARVFQNPLLGTAPGLTILENFRLAALRTGSKLFRIGMNRHFRQLVKERVSVLNLGLENKLDQEVGSLSGGQRQALSLVMATMDKAGVLLMDEPTAALDPRTSALILQLAERIIREYGLTAVLVTHNLKEAIQYGDRLLYMNEGQIRHDIHPEEKVKLQPADLHSWFDK